MSLTRLDVRIVHGTTASGLETPNSQSDAMAICSEKLAATLASVLVVTIIGEVDTGLGIWYRAKKREIDVTSALTQAVNNYCNFLKEISSQHPVAVIISLLPSNSDSMRQG